MKKTILALTSIAFAMGAVVSVNAAPITLDDIDGFRETYFTDQRLNQFGTAFSLMIAGLAIALGIKLKAMGK